MAKLSREDVLKLAHLARLDLSEAEVEQYRTELSEFLGYVEMLKKVDLKGVEPTYQVTGLKNVMRPDKVVDYGASQKELLKNVPEREDDLIKVKRVIE